MSRYERYGSRSLVYSKWHRFYMDDSEPMIDLDAVEYCSQRGCNKALVLIETARDIGQESKPTTVLRGLAEVSQTLALCVLYRVSDDADPISGCRCERGSVRPGCDHGITSFRVRRIWPSPRRSGWQVMTPQLYRERLVQVRLNHIAAEHQMWEAA